MQVSVGWSTSIDAMALAPGWVRCRNSRSEYTYYGVLIQSNCTENCEHPETGATNISSAFVP